MRVTPKTENEIATANLWAVGVYDFEVMDAEDTTSKSSGNDMIKLKIKIFSATSEMTVYDYLLSTANAAFKVRHFAEATGMLAQYERGDMPAHDMIGKTGQCKVGISKDKSGQYPDKNGIMDYVKSASAPAPRAKPVASQADLDDDIPF